MININDNIRFTNVVSMKAVFHYKKMEENIERFKEMIVNNSLHINGPLIYAIYNAPVDEILAIEFFISIKEDHIPNNIKDLEFQSYFDIENMISTTIVKNREQEIEMAYSAMVEFMRTYKLKQITPIFNVVKADKNYAYMMIKIGCIKEKG